QRRDARAGERLHFHSGLVMDRDRAAHDGIVLLHLDTHVALLDSEWMTKRNELVRTLCCHGASNDRGVKYGSFRGAEAVRAQSVGDVRRKTYASLRCGGALRDGFGADIDHGRRAVDVDVRKLGHG